MTTWISGWLDPIAVLLVVLGVAMWRVGPAARRGRTARRIAWAAWAALWLASSQLVAGALANALAWPETDPVAAVAGVPRARIALVILGAGLKTDLASVPLGERLNQSGAARIAGGARLASEIHPALVVLSGGNQADADAALDAAVRAGIPRAKLRSEPRSRDTHENAIASAAITRAADTDVVVLVTSSLHMRRSMREFARAGLRPIPAPVDYVTSHKVGVRDLFPSAVGLLKTHQVLHELLGLLKTL